MELSEYVNNSDEHPPQIQTLREKLPLLFYEYNSKTGGSSYSFQCSNILGHSLEEFQSNPFLWHESIHRDDIKAVDTAIQDAVSKGTRIDIQYRIVDSKGDWHWFLDRADTIKLDSDAYNIFGVAVDITQQKAVEFELEQALLQKNMLMKELNHRIKNNLLMISSLIDIEENNDKIDLQNIKSRLDAIRTVHEMLLHEDSITEVNLAEYIEALVSTMLSSFSKVPIVFKNQVENILLPVSVIIHLGLIVNEIVTNALKHGLSDTSKPELIIKAGQFGEKIELAVFNSGKPITGNIDFDTTESWGIKLINLLAKQIFGTIEIQREPHPEFRIVFEPAKML